MAIIFQLDLCLKKGMIVKMKKNIGLKILIVLIIIAICLISFVGIFVKDKNTRKNIIPEYLLGMNLNGSRVVKLVADDTTNEVIYDNEGKVSEDGQNEDGTLKEGYTKKEEKVNSDEILTQDNYEKSKNVIERRISKLEVREYTIRQNNTNGEITIEIPEDDNTDEVVSYLSYTGKFEIQDSDTEEVLINSDDVKNAKAVYGSTDYGTTVYLQIEFNKEGKKKLEDITNTYVKTTDEDGNETTKKINIKLDDESLVETYFSETIDTGILQLSIGTATTSNETINSYIKQASSIAALISSKTMPIKYELQENRYMTSALNDIELKIMLFVVIAIVAISLIYLIINYKSNGLLASISYIGFIALLLIVLRYANVIISLEAIVAIIAILILNYHFTKYILKEIKKNKADVKEIVKQAYKKYVSIFIPLLIIAVTFTFAEWIPLSSIGMIMFWELAIMALYNYIITRTLLLGTNKE